MPSLSMGVSIFGAVTILPLHLMAGAAVIGLGLLGAAGSASAGYLSLHRRWRQLGEHARALGARVVAATDEKDARAEEAWRLMTVARAHRSIRALPRARARLEALHKQVLEAK